MEPYKNKQGNSGVLAYELGPDFIRLRFRDRDDVYTYSYRSAGKRKIESMKKLAKTGKGLSTFVSRHVRDQYEH